MTCAAIMKELAQRQDYPTGIELGIKQESSRVSEGGSDGKVDKQQKGNRKEEDGNKKNGTK